ncbi:HSP20-like chaperone [Mycena rebaudengoi]|nr:HSP20-like chaperone [Mycena rebaudengoi]
MSVQSQHQRTITQLLTAVREGRVRVVNPQPARPFRPRMDVCNDPGSDHIVVTFELPGVRGGDVQVFIKDGVLTVQGQRLARSPYTRTLQARIDPPDEQVFPVREMRYGYFRRRLRLPNGPNPSFISVFLSDGLLTVSWPRSIPEPLSASLSPVTMAESCKSPRRIPISSVRSQQ